MNLTADGSPRPTGRSVLLGGTRQGPVHQGALVLGKGALACQLPAWPAVPLREETPREEPVGSQGPGLVPLVRLTSSGRGGWKSSQALP